MNTPESNAPATATATATENVAIEKNGLKFNLKRDETKGKGDKAGTAFWNIEPNIAGLTSDEIKAQSQYAEGTATDDVSKIALAAYDKQIAAYSTLLGKDKVVEFVLARLDVAMRSAQLDAGKDTWDMATKLGKARAYITEGDFGRNRQGGIGALAASLANTKQISTLQAEMIQLFMAQSVETDTAKKGQIALKISELMTKLQTLQTPSK